MLSDRTQIGPLPDSSGESGWETDSCSLPSTLQMCHCGIANLLSLISNLPPLTLRDPSHNTQTSHQGRDAARTNGVVRLRTGFKPTAHEYLSISCLLCTANVGSQAAQPHLEDGTTYHPLRPNLEDGSPYRQNRPACEVSNYTPSPELPS